MYKRNESGIVTRHSSNGGGRVYVESGGELRLGVPSKCARMVMISNDRASIVDYSKYNPATLNRAINERRVREREERENMSLAA